MLESPYYLRDSTEMSADPFSDFLKIAKAQPVVSGGFTAGGLWAIRFPAPDKIKFFAIGRAIAGSASTARMPPYVLKQETCFSF
jgi:hypothetical protein